MRLPCCLAMLAPFGLLASCSGAVSPEEAAAQTGVAMRPGQYTVTVSNGKMAEFINADVGQEVRLCANNEPRYVPTRLAREHMLGGEAACGTARFEREGNRLTGSNRCRLVGEAALNGLDIGFDGVIEAERLSGTLTVSPDFREDELDPRSEALSRLIGDLEADLEAVRTGDC